MLIIGSMGALTAAAVKDRAREAGFDLCGIAPAAAFPELDRLREWLARGYAGEMHYMARNAERRADVRAVLPSARSVVSLAVLYNTDRPYSTEEKDAGAARIARYAWGDDYHDVLQQRLDLLVEWMRGVAGDGFEAKAYVDTGPIQERVYAQRAGLGWIGKNTCLIHPALGSWLFLAEVLCSAPLEPDAPALDRCGTCALCLEACPTGALVEPGMLDATRCLSYLTIELKGTLPETQRRDLGAHVYGCDICQDVCPWNSATPAAASSDPAWLPRAAFDRPLLRDLWRLSDTELSRALKGSAMKRTGVRRLRRNLAVALANAGDAALLEEPGDSPSLRDPIVAEHVEWARKEPL
jgi:epoxyqueuosine reductase